MPEKKKHRYNFLTIILLICIIHLAVGSIININKTFNFSKKIKSLEAKRNDELDKNTRLKEDLENFNSDETMESIARNNLKMAEKDEILIIINKEDEDKIDSEPKKEEKANFFKPKKKIKEKSE